MVVFPKPICDCLPFIEPSERSCVPISIRTQEHSAATDSGAGERKQDGINLAALQNLDDVSVTTGPTIHLCGLHEFAENCNCSANQASTDIRAWRLKFLSAWMRLDSSSDP